MNRFFSISVASALLLAGCGQNSAPPDSVAIRPTATANGGTQSAGLSSDARRIAEARNLSPDDINAALKTFMPSGRHDDMLMFASSGHAGQVIVIGLPSMRILRTIAVYTPEAWQGWGFGVGNDILAEGGVDGKKMTWSDTHHPGLSRTNAEYDGEWLFIADKAHARMAVIDLRDFETKQIVKNPIAISDHGGAFVTPNTEYIMQGGQYGHPLGWEYASIDEYNESFRGHVTFWKFDRQRGRIDVSQSFAMELPPYWQDLAQVGWGPSDGWMFLNSINTERHTGGIEQGRPPFESGVSQNSMDYLHIIPWKKAAEVFKAGKYERINGFPVISLETSRNEGLLYFAPEPKSPHGVDIAPKGDFIVVSGKLDPHVTVFSFDKMLRAINDRNFDGSDPYGIPILNYDAVVEARVELGLGPLHTQFDAQGYAYTSLFLDSAVARWTLGGEYAKLNPDRPWQLIGKTSVHYNIGHLAVPHGDTAKPEGKYLVALNKWSIDRFASVGPLLPQNLQLLDISGTGDSVKLLYDMPMGIGEPHYAQIIRADKLKPWEVYPAVGWDPHTQAVHPDAPTVQNRGVRRINDNTVEVRMTAIRSHFFPEHVEVKEGDRVIWHINSLERALDATHGFMVPGFNIMVSLEPGEYQKVEFIADRAGVYPFYCTEFCSALHLEMMGYFFVKPRQ
ncbi:MAG TPA: Sec-dependent nitrous-oxide reductase [Phycisphaerales bacterium]|nr:Sec-dependent nitrous-oxide reductase [Phycisphaerales bacterium]